MAITVQFTGKRPIEWQPTDDLPSATTELTESEADAVAAAADDEDESSTDETLRLGFLDYLSSELDKLVNVRDSSLTLRPMSEPKISVAELKKWILVLQSILQFPDGRLDFLSPTILRGFRQSRQLSLEQFYNMAVDHAVLGLSGATRAWLTKSTTSEAQAQVQKEETQSSAARDAADRKAQATVPKWYGGRCVLSGVVKPHGAHIVPVRAKTADHKKTWDLLCSFWKLENVEELVIYGNETMNILPLSPNAHAMWDRYTFAMRPIHDPEDPDHRIFLQMIWLRDKDSRGGLISMDWDHAKFGGIADFRRGHAGLFPPVRHGDVYQLVTTDTVEQPLPNFHFLQLQYCMHRMLAGMFASEALKIIFSEDPPADQGPIGCDVDTLIEWQLLLDAAVDAGVLDEAQSDLWAKAFNAEGLGYGGTGEEHAATTADAKADDDDTESDITVAGPSKAMMVVDEPEAAGSPSFQAAPPIAGQGAATIPTVAVAGVTAAAEPDNVAVKDPSAANADAVQAEHEPATSVYPADDAPPNVKEPRLKWWRRRHEKYPTPLTIPVREKPGADTEVKKETGWSGAKVKAKKSIGSLRLYLNRGAAGA